MKTERDLQRYLCRRARQRGVLCDKLESRSRRGWPDIVLIYTGQVLFVEVKSPAGDWSLSPLQKLCLSDLMGHGARVVVVDSKLAADAVIEGLIDAGCVVAN